MSEFKLLIAQFRLDYITSNFTSIKSITSQHKLSITLDHNTITLRTTPQTRDPYAIIKMRDILNLILKGTPYAKALAAFPDKYVVDTIMLKGDKTLENRRNRFEGPGGDTLKAIMQFTGADIVVSKKCVCVIATSHKILKEVRWIVENCFVNNVHPAYLLKRMMVRKEIEKSGERVGVDWEKYLPPIKSKLKCKRGDGKKKKAENESKRMEKDAKKIKEKESNDEKREIEKLDETI